MNNSSRSSRRGTALIEFMFVGVPLLLLTVSVVETALAMWQYSTLSYIVETTARYVTLHGVSCTINGNSCGVTVGNVAAYFANQAPGLSSQVTLTLTDASGSTTCAPPFTSCESSGAVFPASTANSVGSDVTVQATFPVNNPMSMFWRASPTLNLGATSTQQIAF